jgi:site-specific recombinase XerD
MRICLTELVRDWELSLKAENRQPKTIRIYTDTLRRFIGVVGDKAIGEVSRSDLRRYLTHRQEKLNPKTGKALSAHTVNQDFRNLRTFLRWCRSEGYLETTPTDSMKAPSLPSDLPKALTPEQIAQLLAATKTTLHPERDELIVRFLLDTGVRLSELSNLDVEDVDLVQGIALVRQGKGRKDRFVPLGSKLRLQLYRYLRDHRQAAPGEEALILSKGGTRLTPRGIQTMVIRLGDSWACKCRHTGLDTRWAPNTSEQVATWNHCGAF